MALAPAALAGLPLERLGELVLAPHPAARWAWFADQPISTLWQRNRGTEAEDVDSDDSGDELVWPGDGTLLMRPAGAVRRTALDAASCAFLDACATGSPLAHAAGEALACDAGTDLAQPIPRLLDAGAFCSMPLCPNPPLAKEPAWPPHSPPISTTARPPACAASGTAWPAQPADQAGPARRAGID